jgi:hypothetical protein
MGNSIKKPEPQLHQAEKIVPIEKREPIVNNNKEAKLKQQEKYTDPRFPGLIVAGYYEQQQKEENQIDLPKYKPMINHSTKLDDEEIIRRRSNRGGPAPKSQIHVQTDNDNFQISLEKKPCLQFSPNDSMNNNMSLPIDLWWLIALYSNTITILKLQSCCKILFTLGQDENIWISHLKSIRPDGWIDPFGASYKILEGINIH